jgi:hypothetical protein
MGNITLDVYGGTEQVQGKATGFFRTEKVNGREWFIDPLGNGFFPLGISHIYSSDSETTVKDLYNYDQKAWVKDWFAKYRELGYNCAPAGGTSPCRDKQGFVDLAFVEDTFVESKLPFVTGVWQFPHPAELRFQQERQDIFSNYYIDLVERRAEYTCGRHKENPYLIGYYYGFGGFIRMNKWINTIMASHANSAGRTALGDLLIEKYRGDVGTFNGIYGTACADMDDIKTTEVVYYDDNFNKFAEGDYAKADPRKKDDFEMLVRALAVQTYKVGYEAIRKHDDSHAILGMYVKAASFEVDTWKEVIRYADVSSPQHVNPILPHSALYQATGKPIFVSDQTFGHDHDARVKRRGLTDEEMAETYELMIRRVLGDPRVCGLSICRTLYDLVSGAMRYRQGALEGIYDERGNPRVPIVKKIKEVNNSLYDHVLNPLSDEQLAEAEAPFLKRLAQSKEPV